MKKNLTAILTAAMITGAFTLTTSAEEASAKVFVTISDGTLKLAQEEIIAKDINGDGKISIDEALYTAHETEYNGGAAAGYNAYDSDYGRSLGMLWGNDCGVYGYYVNNASAMSLDDEVKEGDYISAFCYTDLETWSDTYCYFDNHSINGNSFSITLFAAAWDENYNPVTVPVEGAVITINGERTEFVTDAEGNADITFNALEGSAVISAVSDTQTLVPPVCLAYITEEVNDESEKAPNPTTGVSVSLAGLALSASAAIISRKRK